jgi:gluconolactonase
METTPKEDMTTNYPTIGNIEAYDSSLYDIIAQDAQIEILAEGFTWSEGPVWVAELNSVLFSDVPENKIWRWSEADSLQLFLEPSGMTGELRENDNEPGSNGLILDQNGQLILCQHGDRRLARLTASFDDPKPEFETVAGTYEGSRFNSPNDVVMDSNGNFYFTDPPYGLPGKMDDPTKEISFQGVYRVDTEGDVTLLVDDMDRPNGIELSPDGRTLYIANSDRNDMHWRAYDLSPDGQVSNQRIFYDVNDLVGKQGEQGSCDGLVVAKDGHIFATGPGGVWVFTPEAKPLGKIRTLQATANCTLDDEENYLYMTADGYLMRVALR